MVPKVGFSKASWLEVGWELFQIEAPFDRDFWIPELNTTEEFRDQCNGSATSLVRHLIAVRMSTWQTSTKMQR